MTGLPRFSSLIALVILFIPGVASGQPVQRFPTPYPRRLEHRPSPLPDRIILTWAENPARSQAVTWRTDASVESAAAELALAGAGPGFAAKAETFPATTTVLETDLGFAHYHSVQLKDLIPATKYAYRVGDGVNWSEWFHFRTASERPEPFSFVYFGDAQNDIKSLWSRVLREAYADAPKARFIVHAGDLINDPTSDGEWGEWHRAGGWVNAVVPSIPAAGNHEYGMRDSKLRLTPHWRAQFTLPEHGPPGLEETVYYFDYQGLRIITLNSNEDLGKQADWLERVLSDNPNRWTIIAFHHPIYSSAGRDNAQLRQLWQPLFDRFRVDLVIQGHDHNYGRSGLLRAENLSAGVNLREAASGTIYVVSVSGPKMYSLQRKEWMRRSAQDAQLYQIIKIDGDRLQYEARTAIGEVYDAFELRKRDGQPNELTEKFPPDTTTERPAERSRTALVAAVIAVVVAALLWLLRAWSRSLRRRDEPKEPV